MKTALPRLTLLAASLAFSTSLLAAEDKVLNVYNWSDYIDESVLTQFEEETGIKVVYDVFDANETLESKLLAGASGYDVVVPSSNFLARQIQAGVFQQLDKSKLPNLSNVWEPIQARMDESGISDYSINYMWGTIGIGYNVDKIKERMPDAPVNSYDLVFNPEIAAKFADCGIHILDAPSDVAQLVLNYIGKNPNTTDPKELEAIEEPLLAVRPHIRKFHSSEYINALANGDICIAVGYSGDILQARDRADEAGNGVQVKFVIPKEGTQVWFDQMAIPKSAEHPDNAHQFMNFMLRPEVIAKVSNAVAYANGNKFAKEHMDQEIVNDPGIYPSDETMNRLFNATVLPTKATRALTRIWTRVKSN